MKQQYFQLSWIALIRDRLSAHGFEWWTTCREHFPCLDNHQFSMFYALKCLFYLSNFVFSFHLLDIFIYTPCQRRSTWAALGKDGRVVPDYWMYEAPDLWDSIVKYLLFTCDSNVRSVAIIGKTAVFLYFFNF